MTEVTTASPALIPFTERHEGKVHKAYKDSGGVITIGIGFTMLSKVFADYWRKTKGHALRMGDTITDAECVVLLGKLIDGEYAPPVAKRFAGTAIKQHEFDASVDISFNCGPGSLKWSWAALLAKGAVDQAAARLKTTAITAGGRKLAGLIRRRTDEAVLMVSGNYGNPAAQPSVSTSGADVKAYQQQLATLGFYKGTIDGRGGPLTEGAVKNFQRANDLVVDGVVGPATRAALTRAVGAKQAGQLATGGGVSGAAVGGGTDLTTQAPPPAPSGGAESLPQMDWHVLITAAEWGLAIAAVVLVGSLIWRNRGVILGKRTAA